MAHVGRSEVSQSLSQLSDLLLSLHQILGQPSYPQSQPSSAALQLPQALRDPCISRGEFRDSLAELLDGLSVAFGRVAEILDPVDAVGQHVPDAFDHAVLHLRGFVFQLRHLSQQRLQLRAQALHPAHRRQAALELSPFLVQPRGPLLQPAHVLLQTLQLGPQSPPLTLETLQHQLDALTLKQDRQHIDSRTRQLHALLRPAQVPSQPQDGAHRVLHLGQVLLTLLGPGDVLLQLGVELGLPLGQAADFLLQVVDLLGVPVQMFLRSLGIVPLCALHSSGVPLGAVLELLQFLRQRPGLPLGLVDPLRGSGMSFPGLRLEGGQVGGDGGQTHLPRLRHVQEVAADRLQVAGGRVLIVLHHRDSSMEGGDVLLETCCQGDGGERLLQVVLRGVRNEDYKADLELKDPPSSSSSVKRRPLEVLAPWGLSCWMMCMSEIFTGQSQGWNAEKEEGKFKKISQLVLLLSFIVVESFDGDRDDRRSRLVFERIAVTVGRERVTTCVFI
ncbi:hypothetical protein F7725_021656 [Dissostichus mawsoni]|uniref:Uncharacterized protein n=1 Tax=Dissostichus mawsoni TaxID=36200 RepID=A0A7J5ZF46_DISMA|nr:hypothetical protein F7725_021656 [Dissostichus mawsoni]